MSIDLRRQVAANLIKLVVIGLRIVVDVGRLRQRIGLELFLTRDRSIMHIRIPW